MIYEAVLEKLIHHYTGDNYANEVAQAKKEFFDKISQSVDEESELYDLRMSQFLDWYLFTRLLDGKGKPPVEDAETSKHFKIEPSEVALFKNLKETCHSLFEFLKIRGNDVYVKDLVHRKKYVIKNSPVTAGFAKDQLFNVRLIPFNESFVFAKGFCFHPVEARKYLLKEAKSLKKAEDKELLDFLFKITQMKMKSDQYRHIKPEYIYSNNSQFKV